MKSLIPSMCSFHSKYVSRSVVYYNRSNLVLMAFALIFQGPPVFTQSSEACTPVHVALLTSICAKESASPRGLDLHVGASDGSSHLFLDLSIVSVCLNIALPHTKSYMLWLSLRNVCKYSLYIRHLQYQISRKIFLIEQYSQITYYMPM